MTFGPETDAQPSWNANQGVYGRNIQIIIRPDAASLAKLVGDELDKKCRVVQWVEGWREMDGQRIEGFDNPGVYMIDTELPFQPPEYPAIPDLGPPDYTTVVSLTHVDYPNHRVPSGHTFEVQEHYITAVYDVDDLALLPRGQQIGDPTNPAPVKALHWDFVGKYTNL